MRTPTFAIAAAALLTGVCGAAFGQANAPSMNETRTRTTTPTGPGAPSVVPGTPQTQNPLVNPSAAGTQTEWRGYGSTSGAAANGSSGKAAATPPSAAPKTAMQARQRLQQLGYSHITNLQQSRDGGWRARATQNNHEIDVQLDSNGAVVAQR